MGDGREPAGEPDFRELAETAPGALFRFDAQGRCTYVNACGAQLLDVPDPLGEGWMQAVHPLDREIAAAMWHRPVNTLGVEWVLRMGAVEGQCIHVRLQATPLMTPGGALRGYVASAAEVSPAASKVEHLESAHAFLARAEAIAGIGSWRFDMRTRQLLWSSHMCRIHELPEDHAPRGDEHVKYFPAEARDALEQAVKKSIASGHSWDIQLPMNTAKGRRIWVRSVGEPEMEDGRMVAVVGVLHDLTQERAREEELRAARDAADAANRAKSSFIATMSHEIRTPLNGILGLARLLQDEGVTPSAQRHVALIDQSAQALRALVDDILDMSKIEAGRMDIEQATFDLQVLLDEVVNLHRVRATEKGLLLRLQLAPDVPRHVRSDPSRLRQILSNLVANAVKFTRQGQVDLSTKRLPGTADLVEFTVTDTGLGIADEFLPHLFEPFTQQDVGTSRRFGGTGLGLAIVQQLTGLLGGQVSVESVAGQGSCFRVRLPLPPAEAKPPGSVWGGLEESPRALRVLVVDDHSTNRLVATSLLRKLGCGTVEEANDGKEAVERALAQPYDLVLMDCEMPVMDGYEATRRLRAAGCKSQIVAFTANVMVGARERCLAAGMDDYLSKPVSVDKLRMALDRCGEPIPR
jgi:signal transduction histidine kinase